MNVLLAILAALPAIINGLEQLFAAFPGAGKVKKDIALGGVRSILEGAQGGGVTVDIDGILNTASRFIDGYVAVQNAIGAFQTRERPER